MTQPRREQLISFLRSVLPSDPAQLLPLAGAVCFVVAPRLVWWPVGSVHSPFTPFTFVGPAAFLVLISGFAGYFACFFAGSKPLRRVFVWTILPVIAALFLGFGVVAYAQLPYISVLDRRGATDLVGVLQTIPWASSAGLHFTAAGLILTGVVCMRMRLGLSKLPVTLARETETGEDPEQWRRMKSLIWLLLGPLFLVLTFPLFLVFLIHEEWLKFANLRHGEVMSTMDYWGAALAILALCYWRLGKPFLEILRTSLRWFPEVFLFVSAILPVGVAFTTAAGRYLVERAEWSAYEFGNTAAPQFNWAFSRGGTWLAWLVVAALGEEVAFRGAIRTALVRRFGVYRGIFLTGIAWAAFHFHSDAGGQKTDGNELIMLGVRLGICTSMNFVLCWLVEQSGSLIPATITHTLSNVFVLGGFGPQFRWKPEAEIVLWSIAAVLLYRYWPIQPAERRREIEPETSPEPAM